MKVPFAIEMPQRVFENLACISITQQARTMTYIEPLVDLSAEPVVILGFDLG